MADNNVIVRNEESDPYLYCDFKALIDELSKTDIDLSSATEYDKSVIAAIRMLPQAAVRYIDKMHGAIIKYSKTSAQNVFEGIITDMFIEMADKEWCEKLKEIIDTIDIAAIPPSEFIKIKYGLYRYIESKLNAEPYTIASIATSLYMAELRITYEATPENEKKHIKDLRYEYNVTRWKQFVEFVKKNGDSADYTINVLINLEKGISGWCDDFITKRLLDGHCTAKYVGSTIFNSIINEYFDDERYSHDHMFIDDACFGYPVYYSTTSIKIIINNVCTVATNRIMPAYESEEINHYTEYFKSYNTMMMQCSGATRIHYIYEALFKQFAENTD